MDEIKKPSRPNKAIKELETLTPRYAKNKAAAALIEERIKADNENIKRIFQQQGMTTFSAEGYRVNMSINNRTEFDEEALIKKLKAMAEKLGPGAAADILASIKTKEYVDEDILEDLVYKGVVDAAELSECQIVKPITVLKYKKEAEQ